MATLLDEQRTCDEELLIIGYTRNMHETIFSPISMDVIDLIIRFYMLFHVTGNIAIIDNIQSKLSKPMDGLSLCASHNGKSIYMFGGSSDDSYYSNKCVRYDLKEKKYEQLSNMPFYLTNLTSLNLENGKYVIIGCTKSDEKIFLYDPNQDLWETVSQTYFNYSGSRSCIDDNGVLHIVGGQAGRNSHSTFNFKTNEWKKLKDFPVDRLNGALTLGPNGCLYYFGGDDMYKQSNEIYIFSENKWEKMSISLPKAVHLFAYCNTGEHFITICGNFGGGGYSDLIYIYDFKAQELKTQPNKFPLALCGLSAIFINNEIHCFSGISRDAVYKVPFKNLSHWIIRQRH